MFFSQYGTVLYCTVLYRTVRFSLDGGIIIFVFFLILVFELNLIKPENSLESLSYLRF